MEQQTANLIELDVRPMLAMGEEPFDVIMTATRKVPPGGVLVLTTPFEPVPLYAVLAPAGFVHRTEPRADGAFVVRFTQTGVTPSVTVGEVAARVPAAAAVFARYGIDLCCGGTKTLAFAAQAHGVELAQLVNELRDAAAA